MVAKWSVASQRIASDVTPPSGTAVQHRSAINLERIEVVRKTERASGRRPWHWLWLIRPNTGRPKAGDTVCGRLSSHPEHQAPLMVRFTRTSHVLTTIWVHGVGQRRITLLGCVLLKTSRFAVPKHTLYQMWLALQSARGRHDERNRDRRLYGRRSGYRHSDCHRRSILVLRSNSRHKHWAGLCVRNRHLFAIAGIRATGVRSGTKIRLRAPAWPHRNSRDNL